MQSLRRVLRLPLMQRAHVPVHRSIGLIISIVLFFLLPPTSFGQTAISGWAWSDGIGWISLSCADLGSCGSVSYGLTKTSANKITGYAWSDHVGWISAMPSDLVGCPSSACEVSVSTNGTVSGWMRALNAQYGWDGWISLNGSGYGVSSPSAGLGGWAWGDAVIGWVLFAADQPCATTAGNFCDGNASKYRSPDCSIAVIIADCGVGGCSATTNQCVSPPPPTSTLASGGVLRAIPPLVQPGRTSTISWSVINANSCTVTGNGDSWTGASGSHATSIISEMVIYSLSCTGPGGSLAGSARVRIIPQVREF